MRRIGALIAVVATAVSLAACGSSGKGPVTLNWDVYPEPSGSFAKAAANCSAASHGAYNIKISFLSTASDQQRQTSTGPPSSPRPGGSGSGPAPTKRRSPRGSSPGR
jgi:ABC-type glycerol-3-phosphate transport system substrate-binding protein